MFMFGKKKAAHTTECLTLQIVVGLLLFIIFVAAGIGVYLAHVTDTGIFFGTATGSFSIIAFVYALTSFMKQLKTCMMPCDVCEAMTTTTSKKK